MLSLYCAAAVVFHRRESSCWCCPAVNYPRDAGLNSEFAATPVAGYLNIDIAHQLIELPVISTSPIHFVKPFFPHFSLVFGSPLLHLVSRSALWARNQI